MEGEIKVLYVDDEPGLLEIARLFLEKTGNLKVSVSASAKSALDSPHIRSYDIIISDYQMPEMDGIAFLKEIRHRYGDIPFILFTGRGREEIVIEAINNGADFYLQKGGDPTAQFAELAHKIRQAVLRKQAELSRMRAEDELRESEEKYRSLVELVPDAVLVHREGKVVYVNPACVRLIGANSPDEIIGRNMMPYIHPDDQPMALEHLRLMKEKGVMIPLVEERLFRLDGRPFTVEITARPFTYEGLPSVIVVFRDITDRKKSEDELRAAYEQITASEEELRGQYEELARGERLIRESQEQLRSFMDSATDAFSIWDAGLNLVDLNSVALTMLPPGLKKEEIIGRNLAEFVSGPDEYGKFERYREVIRTGVPLTGTERLSESPSGRRWLNIKCFRVGDGMGIVTSDITRDKEAEEKIREAYVQLAASREELFHSRQMLQIVLNTIPQRVFWKDRNSVYLGCNLPLATDTGVADPKDLVGKDDYDTASKTIAEQYRADDRQVMESGVPRINYEEPQVKPDGSRAWLRTSKIPLRNQEGTIIGVLGTYEDITDQKRAQEKLKESEERNRRILEQAPMPLAFVRNDGMLTFVNNRFARVFGYTTGDIPTLDAWWQRAYPDPDYRNQVIQQWDEAVRQSREKHADIRPAEYQVTCKNGEERTIEISGITLSDGFLATFVDQTERKQMEEALFNSRQMLQTVLDSIPQRVFWKDRNSVFLGCNLPLALDVGFSDPAEIIGKTDYDHASHATADLYLADDRRVMETGQPRINYEEPQIRPDGSRAWLRTSKVPLRNREGTIIGVMGTYEDITDRKQSEEKLRESEERYRSLVESSFDGIAIHQDGILVFVNTTAATLLGYEHPSSIVGKPAIDMIHPDDRALIAARMKDSMEKPLELIHEKFLRADGSVIHADVATTPCTWKSRPAVYVTFRDISEQKKAEDALFQKTEELDQFFSASLDLFCIAGTDGYFRRLNPEWEKTLGYALSDIEGHRFLDFVHPDDLPSTLAATADLAGQKQVLNFTNRYRHKDGSYRWIEWRSFPSGDRIFAAARDITERKQMEEALRQSEERLQLFIRHAPAALAMFDRDMRYLAASRRWMTDYHLGDRDILGCSHYEIFPEITEELKAIHRRGLSGEVVSADEEKFVRQDGSIQWLAWEVRPWYTTGNAIGGIIIFSEDITQRKKAEEALHENEAELSSILHGSPILQFVIDHDHRIISWNKALEEYSRIPAADVVGTDQQWRAFYPHKRPVLADLLVDNNTDGLFKWYAGKLQPSRYVEGAYEAMDFFPAMGASGTWLSFTAAPIRNADGAIIGAVETLEDITERIMATEALRTSETEYRRILENMQDAYIRTDENGIISMVNPSSVRMYGYGSAGEMIGMPAASLYAISGQRDEMLRKLQTSGEIIDFTGDALRKDGTIFPVSLNVQFSRDEEGRVRGTEGIVRDITERRSMEHAIQEANRKLSLLNSLTRHDIVNQLTVIQGFTQLAAMRVSDAAISEYLSKIDAGTATIRRQIEFMKTYHELGVHSPGWSLISETVAKAAGTEVVISGTCSSIEVFADPMLEKVFFNLFDNAMRHGEHVTEITVRCDESPDGLVIIVEDNGIGIPPEEKEKIFTKGFGKHTGLGLFLTKEILSITGITIRENGIPGKGARFEIMVPKGQFRTAG